MKPERVTVADTLKMSIDDRIELAQDIWDSVAALPDAVGLSADDRRMLEERLAAHRRDPRAVIPWDELKSEILGRS
ncbi:putative addiction module component [Phycisphaerae bacterium RAS1]|nr:putative addiction module component [Phycisphaerae bacterium RAS1]